jgi:hypothetical protein
VFGVETGVAVPFTAELSRLFSTMLNGALALASVIVPLKVTFVNEEIE